MRRSILLAIAALLASSLGRTVSAQVVPVEPGARVRLTAPTLSAGQFAGVVLSVSGDTLVLRNAIRPIPLSLVTNLEVSRGRKRPMWSKTAPLWLTGAGIVAGGMIGYSATAKDDYFGPELGAAVVGTLGGALGLIVGTGMAIGIKQDVWESVFSAPTPDRSSRAPSLHIAPRAGGLAVGLRAAF